jgi:uncharacterized phiE125 gp8 family phage protein
MSTVTVSTPTVYPVTLAEAKAHLVIDHDLDDSLVDGLIAAATEYAEQYTNRALVQRTLDYSMDSFPASAFVLPKAPALSVTSIDYTDTNGDPQTVPTTVYGLDLGVTPPVIYLKYGQVWPTARSERNAVTVRFVAGYAGLGSPEDVRAGVPEAIKAAIKLIVGDLYLNRERKMDVQVYNNDTADLILHAFRLYEL